MTNFDKSTQPGTEPGQPERPRPGLPLAPGPTADEDSPLPIRRIVAGVYRRFWQVWLFGLLGGVLGLGVVILRTDSFEAEGQFLLDTGGEQVRIGPDPSLEALPSAIAGNLPYVLTTYDLCAQVVDDVGPEAVLAPFRKTIQAPAGAGIVGRLRAWFANLRLSIVRPSSEDLASRDAHAEATERLQENLSVAVAPYASVVFVRYTAPDPYAARDVLTAFMIRAKKWHLEFYSDSEQIEQVEEGFAKAADQQDKANRKYVKLLESLGVPDYERALTETRERVAELTKSSEQAVHRVSTQESQLQLLKAELAETDPETMIKEVVSPVDPEVERLQALIRDQQETIRNLVADFFDDDLQVVRARKTLSSLQTELAAAQEESAGAFTQERSTTNPRYERLQNQIFEIELSLNGDRLDASRWSDRLAAEKTALEKLERREGEHAELLAALQRAASRMRIMDSQMERVQQKQALNRNDLSSLRKLQQPLPGERQSIRSVFVLGGGIAAGSVFGLVLALGLALLDRRVRFASDLESIACGPVLGVVPREGRRNVARYLRERRNQ